MPASRRQVRRTERDSRRYTKRLTADGWVSEHTVAQLVVQLGRSLGPVLTSSLFAAAERRSRAGLAGARLSRLMGASVALGVGVSLLLAGVIWLETAHSGPLWVVGAVGSVGAGVAGWWVGGLLWGPVGSSDTFRWLQRVQDLLTDTWCSVGPLQEMLRGAAGALDWTSTEGADLNAAMLEALDETPVFLVAGRLGGVWASAEVTEAITARAKALGIDAERVFWGLWDDFEGNIGSLADLARLVAEGHEDERHVTWGNRGPVPVGPRFRSSVGCRLGR